jgi:hypothetical protein
MRIEISRMGPFRFLTLGAREGFIKSFAYAAFLDDWVLERGLRETWQ